MTNRGYAGPLTMCVQYIICVDYRHRLSSSTSVVNLSIYIIYTVAMYYVILMQLWKRFIYFYIFRIGTMKCKKDFN